MHLFDAKVGVDACGVKAHRLVMHNEGSVNCVWWPIPSMCEGMLCTSELHPTNKLWPKICSKEAFKL
jgi:hypothetical protein